MKYIVISDKSVKQASEDLQKAIIQNKFGVIVVHDMKAMLKKKGVEFDGECDIVEFCNPNIAKKALDIDMNMSMMMPCRISVYQDRIDGKTRIGTIKPTSMIPVISDLAELKPAAENIEQAMIKIIDEAK